MDPDDLAPLFTALQDDRYDVWSQAALTLLRLRDPAAVPQLPRSCPAAVPQLSRSCSLALLSPIGACVPTSPSCWVSWGIGALSCR
jgi:HEAT repeat protein